MLDLAILAEVLSGREMDSVGSLSPMDGPKKMTKWSELRSRRPEWFKASQKQINVWHHSEAVQSLSARRYAEGLAHLQELASSLPYFHDGLRRKRIDAAIQLAKWDIARSDLATLRNKIDTPRARYELALLSLLAHQTDEYARLCTDGMKPSSGESNRNTPQSRFWDLWSCVLALNALSDYSQAVQFSRQLVELEPTNPQFVQCLGGLLLRAGLYEEALTFLDKSIQLAASQTTSVSYSNYLLAITHQKFDHPDEAKRWLEKANTVADEELTAGDSVAWNRRGTIELLRREAESLIRPSE